MQTETMFSRKIPANIDIKKVKLTNLRDPVIYKPAEGEDYDFVIILENHVGTDNKTQLDLLMDQCQQKFGSDIRILVLSVFPFYQMMNKIKGNITDFYINSAIDFSKYIKPNSYVITVGRSLYSVSNADLMVEHFYDFIFNKTYFYSPILKSYVFPIDNIRSWSEIDFDHFGYSSYSGMSKQQRQKAVLKPIVNWEYNFAMKQLERAMNRPVFNRTIKPQIATVSDMDKFYAENIHQTHAAIDTETDGFNPFKNKIGCLSMSFDGRTGYYIPWDLIKEDLERFGEFIKPMFQIYQNGKFDIKMMLGNGIARKYLHIDCDTWNLGHILNEMRSNSLKTLAWLYTKYGGYDKKLDQYVKKHKITNYLEIPDHIMESYSAMDAVVTFQCYEEMEKQLDIIDKKLSKKYNDGWTLRKYFYELVVPTLNSFIDIEYKGAYVNKQAVLDEREIMLKEIEELILVLWNDKTFNMNEYKDFNHMHMLEKNGAINLTTLTAFKKFLNSPTQLGKFIESKRYPAVEIGKRNIYKSGDPELTEWINMGHDEFKLIAQYRKLRKFIDSYVGTDDKTGIFKYLVEHEDGTCRVHSTFFVMLALSHRFKSKEPNLQQIPKRNEDSRRIRKFFCPPSEDYYVAEFDAAGFQLRIGAALSHDAEMYRVFTELGGDMHSMTAVSVLQRDMTLEQFIQRKKEDALGVVRFKAKAINFGFEFGSSAFAFAGNVLKPEWSEEEIKEYIEQHELEFKKEKLRTIEVGGRTADEDFLNYWVVAADIRTNFFKQYEGLKKWVDETPKQAEKDGYIRSSFGAIRRLPELNQFGKDGKTKSQRHYKNLKNQSLNSPVQNFEIALIVKTINEITKFITENNLKTMIFATIHDSINLYIHKDEVKIITMKLKEIFEEDIPENAGIPMELEGKIADYFNKDEVWGEGTDALEFIENL